MAYIKGLTVEIGADASGLVRAINNTESGIRDLNREAGELNRSLKFDPRNTELMAQKQRVLTERVSETNDKVKDLEKLQAKLIKAQKNDVDVTENLNDVNRELAVTKSKMDGYTKALQEANREMVKYSGASGQTIADLEDFGEEALQASNKLKGVSIAGGAAIAGMSAAAVGFESAFAGVQKTMSDDITPQQLDEIRKGIVDMSKEVPSGTTAISEVAEAAGQLGIKTENILSFTRVMIDMGESTNLSADAAATSMARFANIVGMSQQDFDRLGSVIVELGNNFATTEREIVEMAMRLAGAGAQIGMTESDIMALATALSSVGIEAQAGGSAFSKVMVQMQLAVETGNAQLQEFAEVAGMSGEQFATAFREDATQALLAFIKGLADLDESGDSAIKVLDDMEIKEVRLRDALLRAAGASDLFSDAISMGSDAWEENIALAEEANVRYETTESKLAMMKNQFIALGIQLGEVLLPFMKAFAKIMGGLASLLGKLPKPLQAVAVGFTAIAAAAAPVLWVSGKLSTTLGSLLGWLKNTSFGAQVFAEDIAKAGVELVTTGSASELATGKLATLGTTLGRGAVSLGKAVAGLGGFKLALGAVAVAGVGKLVSSLREDAIPEVDLFANKIGEAGDTVDGFGRTVGESLVEVSETTKEQVGGFMELSDEMSQLTLELQSGLYDSSQEHTEKMIDLNEEMTEYTIQKAIESKEAQLAEYQELFDNSETITAEQQEMILSYVNQEHSERVNILRATEEELTGIYREIAEQGGVITQEQQQRINELQNIQKEESVNTLSETEAEAAVIRNRMKAYGERMTAEQAANIVQEYNRMRDETIQASEEQRDETVRLAEEMRAKNPARFGEMADKMIADANRLHADTVEAAHKTRDEGIEELARSVKGLENTINLETGKMKSKLGSFFSRVTSGARDASASFRDMARTWRDTHFPDKYANVHYSRTGDTAGTLSKYNNGLYEVPFNNYQALLHKGERVLTANENKQLKQQGYLNSTRNKLKGAMESVVNNVDNSVVNNQFVLAGTYHVREEADIDRVARELNRKLAQKGRF